MNTPMLIVETEEIDAFEPQVNQLLFALLGHSCALTTDRSDVGDFMPWPGKPEPELLEAVEALVGFPVTVNDKLVDLARALARQQTESAALRH